MSILGLVIFAVLVFAACYNTCYLQRGAQRKNLPNEIERLL